MWIDACATGTRIRLEGVLDESTGSNLLRMVEYCLADGAVDVALDTRGARLGEGSGAVIDRVERQVTAARGHLRLERAVA
jgi:hypothetical protein